MIDAIAELRDLNLELESLKARKNAIKAKLAEHRDSFTDEEIAKSTVEAQEIRTQITSVQEKIKDAQERAKNEENKEGVKNYMENRDEIKKVDLRTAFAKYVLFESTHGQRKDAELTDIEKRALGVAVTTTSDTYTAPSTSVDGVNNGGVFIPETVVMDILREDELESPIYRDIATTAIKGKIKFPYKMYNSGAKTKAELAPTENESVQWGILSGATGNYTDSIVLTFEEEAMAIEEFTDYLISLIGESMRELLINDYIYGTGTNDHVYGLTYNAIDGKYAASDATNYRKNIEAAIKKLPIRKRAGAKIYLASDIFDGITFEKDSNGNYILPVLNGGGLTKISTFQVEMDPYLKEGDFIIGNIAKWYKANINKTMELGLDVSNQKRTKTYTTHMMVTAVPVPNSIVYAKKGS